MNRLVDRLERELAAASNRIDAGELSARLAGNLARLGKFHEAEQRIASLRQEFGAGQSGRVTVWMMLAEGLLHYYRSLAPAALDRITRAQRLGEAMGYQSFVSLVSAWKAHIEFENSNYGAMVESLRAALSSAGDEDWDAHARIGMVLANAYTQCGQADLGQRWFVHGHSCASKNGDQASIEALLYNRAAFRFSWLRAESCVRRLDASELRVLRSEVESTKNLQRLTGIAALDNHILLVEAGLLLLEREFARARAAFGVVRSLTPFADYNFNQNLIDLELAFCDFCLGDGELRMHEPISEVVGMDVDERMYASWISLQMRGEDARQLVEFNAHRLEYEKICDQLRESLRVFASF